MGSPAIITDPQYADDDVIKHQPNPTVQGIPLPGVPEAPVKPAIPLGAPQGQHPAIAPVSPLHVKSGIAGLWDKESNIHNPVLRTAAKTGTGILGTLEGIGNIVAPRLTSAIPGTRNNKEAAIRTDEANQASAAHTGLENAQAKEALFRANPPEKDREEWEQVKGLSGLHGEPVEREKTSGTYRLAQLPQGVQPTEGPAKDAFDLWQKDNPKGTFTDYQKAVSDSKPATEKDQDVSDYLASNKLDDTPANREKARTAIATRTKGDEGTWTMAENDSGHPILFNTKTAATKAAPAGVNKAGSYQKNFGAAADAQTYAQNYIKQGAFTGPGDEALMEKFFELSKPSTGFRMTQPQIDMLRNAQSWYNSAEAKAYHAATGTWFSDDLRKQIVKTMDDLATAKLSRSKAAGGTETPSDKKVLKFNAATGRLE